MSWSLWALACRPGTVPAAGTRRGGDEPLRHRAALDVQPGTSDAPISKGAPVPGLAAPTRASVPRGLIARAKPASTYAMAVVSRMWLTPLSPRAAHGRLPRVARPRIGHMRGSDLPGQCQARVVDVTATIVVAPATRAAMMSASPTAPVPGTAMDEPARGRGSLRKAGDMMEWSQASPSSQQSRPARPCRPLRDQERPAGAWDTHHRGRWPPYGRCRRPRGAGVLRWVGVHQGPASRS